MTHTTDIDIEIELDNGQLVTYNVEYVYTPGLKARRYGHPDDWHDSEGPEVDIIKISYERPLTKDETVAILDQWEDYIIEKIVAEEEGHD